MVKVDSEKILPLVDSIIEYIELVRKVKTNEIKLKLTQDYLKPEVKFLGFVIRKGRYPIKYTSIETMAKAVHGVNWRFHMPSDEFTHEYKTAKTLKAACEIANSSYGKRTVLLDKNSVNMISWFNEIDLGL